MTKKTNPHFTNRKDIGSFTLKTNLSDPNANYLMIDPNYAYPAQDLLILEKLKLSLTLYNKNSQHPRIKQRISANIERDLKELKARGYEPNYMANLQMVFLPANYQQANTLAILKTTLENAGLVQVDISNQLTIDETLSKYGFSQDEMSSPPPPSLNFNYRPSLAQSASQTPFFEEEEKNRMRANSL